MKTISRSSATSAVALFLFSAGLALAQPSLVLPPPVTPTVTQVAAAPYVGPGSFFSATFSNLPSGLSIGNQTYLAWCADVFAPVNFNQTYTAYNTAMPSTMPSNANYGTWGSVNWILNNKPNTGYPQHDAATVQQAIWKLLNGLYYPQTTPPAAPAGYLLPEPNTDNLVTAALANANFIPGPGQVVGVLLYVDGWQYNNINNSGDHYQDILIEVPVPSNCTGAIGDFVWHDLNGNGLQDAGEPGINGVTVQLYKNSLAAANLVASTVTGAAPASYGFNPPGPGGAGYYQFSTLCGGTYVVYVNPNQPALAGYTPSPTQANNDTVPAMDSNPNPFTRTLLTNSSIDETIDFGYTSPAAPPVLTCGASTGTVGSPYTSSLTASGGIQPYTFSATGLPSWLTLVPSSGALSGTPTSAGTFNFTAMVVDSRGNAAGTTAKSCTITTTITPPTSNCVVVNAVQGMPITPVTLTGSGGVGGPYTFSATGLPTGITLSSTGTLSGTPTVSGAFTYSVTVTDSAHNSSTHSCSMTVQPPPPPTCVGGASSSGASLNLGTDSNYIFIDTGSTHLGWNAYQLNGNVLFGQGLTVALSGGNNGGLGAGYSVYKDSTTNISGNLQNPLTYVSVPTSQTAAAAVTARSVSSYASMLTTTQTFSTINNTLTINGNGGLNVISVGSVQNATLTINGSANDFFVFNVSGSIQTNHVMTLTGGVPASHILWNLIGTGTVLQTSGGDFLVGTFLATNGGQFQFSELQLTGELINTGGNIQLVSGNHTLTHAGFTCTQ